VDETWEEAEERPAAPARISDMVAVSRLTMSARALPSTSLSDWALTFTVRSPPAMAVAAATIFRSEATMACIARRSWAVSSAPLASMRASRSPSATCSATCTAAASGVVMLRVITTPATTVRTRAAAMTTNMSVSVRLTLVATTASRACMAFACFIAKSTRWLPGAGSRLEGFDGHVRLRRRLDRPVAHRAQDLLHALLVGRDVGPHGPHDVPVAVPAHELLEGVQALVQPCFCSVHLSRYSACFSALPMLRNPSFSNRRRESVLARACWDRSTRG
jgi:hypothetical protein